MTLNTAVLNERIQENREEYYFYWKALEMLVKKYRIDLITDGSSFTDRVHLVEGKELALQVANGEVPPLEELMRMDTEEIDGVVSILIYLVGTLIGIRYLEEVKEIQGGNIDQYIQYILSCTENPSRLVHAVGFAALTLALGKPPVWEMINRLFPIEEGGKSSVISGEILQDLHRTIITKYIEETLNK